MKAKTTRRLLEVRRSTGRFGRNESHPLDCDLLVMDEAPIADVGLMQGVLKPIGTGCRKCRYLLSHFNRNLKLR
jgi:ATP-dependent exoDNAse (exonuclease V) alpha subunit